MPFGQKFPHPLYIFCSWEKYSCYLSHLFHQCFQLHTLLYKASQLIHLQDRHFFILYLAGNRKQTNLMTVYCVGNMFLTDFKLSDKFGFLPPFLPNAPQKVNQQYMGKNKRCSSSSSIVTCLWMYYIMKPVLIKHGEMSSAVSMVKGHQL